jgi:alkanesulfonate monooxygenase SsuD/methylene tetrahydromethanopterin reductase-like flavin-dependent oxidoreductase (luciferase family)
VASPDGQTAVRAAREQQHGLRTWLNGCASAATAVVISHVAAGTERIRVGAGGVMLPNHAPLAFASHFAPDALLPALQVYRSEFRPSGQLRQPYAMVGVNVLAADDDAEAHRLFTSHQRFMAATLRGGRGLFPSPVEDIDDHWSATEKAYVSRMLRRSFVGSAEPVRDGLEEFIEETGADELIVSSPSFHHAERVRSYEILADVREALVRARATPSPAESSP